MFNAWYIFISGAAYNTIKQAPTIAEMLINSSNDGLFGNRVTVSGLESTTVEPGVTKRGLTSTLVQKERQESFCECRYRNCVMLCVCKKAVR